jgi:hypothetical protein
MTGRICVDGNEAAAGVEMGPFPLGLPWCEPQNWVNSKTTPGHRSPKTQNTKEKAHD